MTAPPATLVAPETTPDADEFDLDVKLQPVERHHSPDRAIRATGCSCVECDTNANTLHLRLTTAVSRQQQRAIPPGIVIGSARE